MRPPTLLILAFGALGIAASGAQADLIQFTFTGEVTLIDGEPAGLWQDVALGSPWSVTYVFDNEAPDLIPFDPTRARYEAEWLRLEIGGASTLVAEPTIELTLDVVQIYEVNFSALPIAGGDVELFGFDVFKSDALPRTLHVDRFNLAQLEMGSSLDNSPFFLQGEVLNFSSEVVPAPSTLPALLLPALFCARLRMRRSWRPP
jgi:hypothetical protein